MSPERPHTTIAIVDDDDSVRRALSRLLRLNDYDTEIHASGREFLASAALHDVDCLLLDMHMPGLSGIDVLEAVRDAATKLPVVLMTGRYEVDLAQRSLDVGASAFLRKPIGEDELIAALDVALGPRL